METQVFSNIFYNEQIEDNSAEQGVSYEPNEVHTDVRAARYMAGANAKLSLFEMNDFIAGFDYRREESFAQLFASYAPLQELPIERMVRENNSFIFTTFLTTTGGSS
ncbi:MAG: hypothetical protein M5R36_00500 [Deltaproteobacteria bacterium]|nr:hypothetical protein [Deltaproteobacteria bacterium]